MLKGLTRELTLAIQTRTGATPAFFVAAGIVAIASLTAFAFLCVAGYDWFAVQVGSVFAALIMTGIFVLIAIVAAVISTSVRRRARERAILERTARARAPSWLLDPRILATAVQIGREFGWQRIVPVALLGFMAAQWAREHQQHKHESAD